MYGPFHLLLLSQREASADPTLRLTDSDTWRFVSPNYVLDIKNGFMCEVEVDLAKGNTLLTSSSSPLQVNANGSSLSSCSVGFLLQARPISRVPHQEA
jgi:hypothetical protein